MLKRAFMIFIIIFSQNSIVMAKSFYEGADKYRGFYWFETKPKEDKVKIDKMRKFQIPSPEEAAKAIELRKKELDDARNQMIEMGFREDAAPAALREAVLKYKKLELLMFSGALRLAEASDMTNFTNPEIANLLENPTNVFANKIKRKEEGIERANQIKDFANNFDLLLFASDDCAYCKAFAPVITHFVANHGFTLDVTTLNGPTQESAAKLGIDSMPTLIAISKDGAEMFEVARGLATFSELEGNIVLANILSKEKRQNLNAKNSRSDLNNQTVGNYKRGLK